ncbi:GAF domain-containing protein [Actinoallomurus liliacearum]|uniref:GAF domain-containing protein n=1 Tax=Actinoallomurus liliacearum TaxID=1080073 RepID=A0ABP8U044_9ACTN
MASPAEAAELPEQLCDACIGALPVDGVGLSLMTRDPAGGRMLLGASDDVGARIEELQFRLGEGPCVTAFGTARPVLVPDVQADEARARWPMFTREAETAGAAALFAFPLLVGVIGIGVLDCHRARTGPLAETAEALVVADAVTTVLLNFKIRSAEGSDGEIDLFSMSTRAHALVYQAVGSVAGRLGISTEDALARLRAHAFSHSRSLEAVADDVLTGRLQIPTEKGQSEGE